MADIFEIVGRVSLDGLNEAERNLNNLTDTGERSASKLGKLGSIAKTAGKGLLIGTGAVVTAGVGLVKQVSASYGALQQSIGGIETLFGESAQRVIDNANNAYKTAGMSANDYMQQVTSFSASLLQSLGGDTEKACESADMAIIDMSDNANKMGTSMEAITNAYQGFAKQNYTMLDNLKLGYGGTKTEMERLLADASKISGIKYDISNLNDVYTAIHVIQQELGITGTTALEAGATIEGSFGSLSASWQNFLAGLGNPAADMEAIVKALADAIAGAVTNVTPVIDNMVKVLPTVVGALVDAVKSMLPTLINTFSGLITQVITAIVDLLPTAIPLIVDCVMTVVDAITQNASKLIDGFIQLITQLTVAIAENLPALIPVFIDCLVQIAQALVENAPIILDAILSIGSKFSEGLSPAIDTCIGLVEVLTGAFIAFKAGAMIQSVVQGFQTAQMALSLYKLETEGASIAQGLLNGQLTIGETVVGLLTGQVTLAEIATGLWSKAQGVLNTVMSANPIALVVMAIGALIAIVVVAYNKCDWFREAVNKLGEGIKNAFVAMIEWFKKLPETISNVINNVVDGISTFFTNIGKSFSDFFTNTIESIKNWFTSVGEFFSNLPENIGYALGFALGKVVKWSIDLKDSVVNGAKAFVENTVKFFSELPSRIKEWLDKTIKNISNWCTNAVETVKNWGINFIKTASTVARDFFNSIIKWFKDLPYNIKKWLTNAIIAVKEWAINLIDMAVQAGKDFFDGIINWFKQLPDKIKEIGENLIQGLWNGIKNGWDWLTGKISDFCDGVVKGFKDGLGIHSPSKLTAEIGRYLTQGIGVGIDEDDSAEKSIRNKVDSVLGIANDSMANIKVGATMDDVVSESPMQKYQVDFNAQFTALSNSFDKLLAVVNEYLPNIASGVDKDIIIDGNSLAIGMSRKIDNQLGRMATAKGRGNI